MKQDEIFIEERFPGLRSLPAGTLLGYHHYRLPSKELIIPREFVRAWDGILSTESRFTREWIETLPRIIRKREILDMAETVQAPLYAKVGVCHSAYYVDIRTAYPSVYSRIGWGIEYKRDGYFSMNEPLVYPYPMEWKVGRSMVVSQNRQGWARYWNGKDIDSKQFPNRKWNPSLRLATLDILQAVARFAVNVFGAFYYNVDGAIIPESQVLGYLSFLSSLGLVGRIKQRGYTVVVGTHSVNIGGKQIGAGMGSAKSYSNLALSLKQSGWLLDRFSR